MIGALKDRVIIQELTAISDGAGGTSATWADVKTVYAKVKEVVGTRAFEYGQIREGQPYEIQVRTPSGYSISKANRLQYKGLSLAVQAVWDSQQRDGYTEIIAFRQD